MSFDLSRETINQSMEVNFRDNKSLAGDAGDFIAQKKKII